MGPSDPLVQQPARIYDRARLAAAYATSRPPLHRQIIARVADTLQVSVPRGRALDVGCGAGLSTAALGAIATSVVGLDPALAMLNYRRAVAPRASFVVGSGEALPFAAGIFDVVTAAGTINYTDPARFLPEVARVLAPKGVLVVYDFSPGRRTRGGDELWRWYEAFEQRYPAVPGYEMDVAALPYPSAGLTLTRIAPFELFVEMTRDAYVDYVMSETNIEWALARGESEPAIREWCLDGLAPVFAAGPREVGFDGYAAYVRRREEASPRRVGAQSDVAPAVRLER